MDGGGHTHNEERGAEKLMDDYLKSQGLHRKKIAKDGSCLFRAVAEQVLHSQSLHTTVRAKCVEFLRQNRESYEAFIEGNFEDYLVKLQDPQQWVGEVEISALAVMYKRDFQIYQEPGKPAVNITDNNFEDKVRLCFLNGNHYDSVYPISHMKSAALCQSVLYEVLYDRVFQVERSCLGLCQRVGRPTDLLSDDRMAACASSDESDPETGDALWVENGTSSSSSTRHSQSYRGRGRGRLLPERVRRSLNPTLFRNVEFDVWHKTKRAQQKLDYCIAAGMHFSAGDRCQVRLEGSGKTYSATVTEVPPKTNMVTVHIEELGKRHVPLWSLRPPSDESSWSTVVNKDKRLSNGHGDWEERGKGRGRGKSVPPFSSGPQAPPPGPTGRVQKQHSWPQQTTSEEQGGPKPSRKSVSSAESAPFGLTEEERLAKEEEERNVALVEIQLRDELSFPALGAQTGLQGDGGRRRGGDKRRPHRNKTKSPVEDVRAASPSAAERPKSSTPPLATTSSTSSTSTAAAPPPKTTPPSGPALPPAAPSSSDSAPTSLKASTPNTNMAATGSAPSRPPACAAPAAKTNAQSYAGAAPGSPSPPPPSVTGGAAPHPIASSSTVFSLLTPVLPAASSPPTLTSSSSSKPPSSSSLPPKPAASPPPPTFIAPIAPSPGAAQGFLPRSFSPVSSLPHSPSPPPPTSSSSSSSSSLTRPAAHEAPAQTTCQSLQIQTSMSQTQVQTQTQEVPVRPPLPPPQSHTEVAFALPQNQIQVSQVPQSQGEMVYPQLPHPPLSMPPSASPPPPSTQTPQEQPEAPPPPPSSSQHPPHPQLLSAHALPLFHPPSVPGAVPLQKLSQLYQDPLYPGFPQLEKGEVAPTPPYSLSRAGDDLSPDVNILRFFYNLGVKAYNMPMYPPCMYLLPLQQAHSMHPKLPSRSPSPTPHPPPPSAPARHQEPFPPPQYPPAPAPPDPPFGQVGYPGGQPPPHRMPCGSLPWMPPQMPPPPRNATYPVGFPSPTPPPPPQYSVPPPSSQVYHPGHRHALYPHPMSPYPPSPLGYPSPSGPEELQAGQGPMEQLQPANGDSVPGHGPGPGPGPGRVPGHQEGLSAAANVANANNNRTTTTMVVPGVNSFSLKKEQGESLTRAVLLVDPPLNNRPILALVSNSDVGDTPVSMTTIKPSSTPGSPYSMISKATVPRDNSAPLPYLVHPKPYGHPGNKPYVSRDALSVGCSTEDDWEEAEGFKPPTVNLRGARRNYGGGRGRGGYRRRQEGGSGYGRGHYGPSHRGRGW